MKITGKSTVVGAETIDVLTRDAAGDILSCSGLVKPTDTTSGYAKGCVFTKTNATTGYKATYENVGTKTSCSFNLVGTINTGMVMTGNTAPGFNMHPAAAGAGLKIHTHLADGSVYDYANEFKGECVRTSGFYDGITAQYHLAASGTAILRSIIGVAYLDSGFTLSGTLPTTSWLVGGLFSADVAGILDGTSVHVLGAYAGLGSMTGATLTACEHMAALMVDSQVTQVPLAGESELIYLNNGLGGTLGQVMYINANDRISEFAHFANCATMISAKTNADIAYAHYRKLLVTVDGLPGWIYIEMAA
jgi:hypothetical protein